jgi:tetratricopeptide (TPR) repeat protein
MRTAAVIGALFVALAIVANCGKEKSTAPEARLLTIVSGDRQDQTPGSSLGEPFAVLVTDNKGEPVPGQVVQFRIMEGSGSLSVESATTDEYGKATTLLTLGEAEGAVRVEARVAGYDEPVVFTATCVSTRIQEEINRGKAFLELEEYDKAVDAFVDGLAKEPNNETAHYYVAVTYARWGWEKKDQVLSEYKKLLQLGSEYVEDAELRTAVAEILDLEDALDDPRFLDTVRYSLDLIPPSLDLGRAFLETGCRSTGLHILKVLLTADPENREILDLLYSSLGMAWIPGGTFQMGSNDGDSDEKPVHTVTLGGFWIGKYEVTVKQYREFCLVTGRKMPDQPGWSEENHPVVNVFWHDAAAYAQWRNCRLPTEAEWEYAARGGLDGKKYPWGDAISHDYANYEGTGGRDRWANTSPVGSFPANGYELYDMAGNVWEWCSDWYDTYSSSEAYNPTGPGSGTYRVVRGGSWGYGPNDLRCAGRARDVPDDSWDGGGFRVARTP